MRNKILLFKIVLVFSVIIISLLSSNNFINNDNYFPISYLYMLEYPEFYNALSSFIPFEVSDTILKIIFYLFITPLSSTYAPLPYVLYPILISINDPQTALGITLALNIFINVVILLLAHRQFKNQGKENLFLVSYLAAAFGIGHMIYLGSNMPYSYILNSTFLIMGLAINPKKNISKDVWTVLTLFLLNYQILFLIPAFFLVKMRGFFFKKMKLTKSEYFSIVALSLTVLLSIVFITARGKLTGTHTEAGMNWNSGINNEFKFDPENNLFIELLDLIQTTPKSILYHLNEKLYDSRILSVILLLTLSLFFIGDIYKKQYNRLNIFCFTVVLSFIFLVLLEKTVYGPTRHTLFLVPITLIYTLQSLQKINFKLIQALFLIIAASLFYFNVQTLFSRKNNFVEKLQEVSLFIEDFENHDVLLSNCTYQPFMIKSFRNSIKDKRVFFFCGSRLQQINSQLANNDSILIIDATGQNKFDMEREINKRSPHENYVSSEFKLIKQLVRLDYNMEQKDFTQFPKKTGLFIWEAENKLKKLSCYSK